MDINMPISKKEYAISIRLTHLYSGVLMFLLIVVLLLCFSSLWDYETFIHGATYILHHFNSILIVFGGFLLHQLIHAITASRFTTKGFNSIKFDLRFKILPYYHCKEPLTVNQYKIVLLMPIIVLGIIPLIFAFISGNGIIFIYGLFFVSVSSTDLILLFLLRRAKKEDRIFRHPDKAGFYIE